jgi:hypothetical protein
MAGLPSSGKRIRIRSVFARPVTEFGAVWLLLYWHD